MNKCNIIISARNLFYFVFHSVLLSDAKFLTEDFRKNFSRADDLPVLRVTQQWKGKGFCRRAFHKSFELQLSLQNRVSCFLLKHIFSFSPNWPFDMSRNSKRISVIQYSVTCNLWFDTTYNRLIFIVLVGSCTTFHYSSICLKTRANCALYLPHPHCKGRRPHCAVCSYRLFMFGSRTARDTLIASEEHSILANGDVANRFTWIMNRSWTDSRTLCWFIEDGECDGMSLEIRVLKIYHWNGRHVWTNCSSKILQDSCLPGKSLLKILGRSAFRGNYWPRGALIQWGNLSLLHNYMWLSRAQRRLAYLMSRPWRAHRIVRSRFDEKAKAFVDTLH